mgnify:CR=1 FL=1
MKNYELLDAIGGISPNHIENATRSKTQSKKHIWKLIVPAAACLCVIIGGIAVFNHNSSILPPIDITQPELSDSNDSSVPGTNSPSSQQGQDVNGPMIEAQENNGNENQISLPMISSYGESTYMGDMAVINGAFELSDSLRSALQEYGNNARYRVIVELFKDGVQLNNSSEIAQLEINRLTNDGYTVALETYNNGYIENNYLTLHATFDQINDFSASNELGYFILLYGEYFGIEDSAVDENVNSEARIYSSEILDLQNRISTAMSNNELPFVISSAILESPDRILVTVNTTDEALINQLKAFDTTGKLLEIEYSAGLPTTE